MSLVSYHCQFKSYLGRLTPRQWAGWLRLCPGVENPSTGTQYSLSGKSMQGLFCLLLAGKNTQPSHLLPSPLPHAGPLLRSEGSDRISSSYPLHNSVIHLQTKALLPTASRRRMCLNCSGKLHLGWMLAEIFFWSLHTVRRKQHRRTRGFPRSKTF